MSISFSNSLLLAQPCKCMPEGIRDGLCELGKLPLGSCSTTSSGNMSWIYVEVELHSKNFLYLFLRFVCVYVYVCVSLSVWVFVYRSAVDSKESFLSFHHLSSGYWTRVIRPLPTEPSCWFLSCFWRQRWVSKVFRKIFLTVFKTYSGQ